MGESNVGRSHRLISVIVPVYNDREVLHHGLRVIDQTVYDDLEVIIIDNYGSDGSMAIVADWLKKTSRQAIVIPGSKTHSLTAALNAGVEHSKGEYVLFLSPDTIFVQDDWLTKLVVTLEDNLSNAIVCPTVLYPDGRKIQTTGTKSFHHVFASSKFTGKDVSLLQRMEPIRVNDMPVGSVFLFRKSIFARINGFDEGIHPVIFTETDFFWRATLAGGRMYWNPQSLIVHIGGYSLGNRIDAGKEFRQIQTEAFKSTLRSILRNSKTYMIPIEMLFMIGPAMSAHPKETLISLAKAIVSNLHTIDDIFDKRKRLA